MSKDDLIRIRTDTVISLLRGEEINKEAYQEALKKSSEIAKVDLGLVSSIVGAEHNAPYSMRNLREPMTASSMVIPDEMSAYLAGHAKVSTDYVRDWPQASADNPFGDHHPFGFKSSCCPLLHGAAHGEPEYAYHIMRTLDNDSEIMKKTAEKEKRKDVVPNSMNKYLGQPIESQYDLHTRDRNKHSFVGDDEYFTMKQQELMDNFGLLPYLFGLEWTQEDQRHSFMDLLSEMAGTEDMISTDAQRIANQFQEKTGMSWGRALRNWRERFTPMIHWWERASDRHGPTEPHPGDADSLSHFKSPWVQSEEGIAPSMTYHWWEPFQHWGGVGRNRESLNGVLSQSYPDIFNGGWMNDVLVHQSAEHPASPNGSHSHGGCHFPKTVNEMEEDDSAKASLTSGFTPDDTFDKRRSMWSSASNHAHLHPSEIQGAGGRMIVPTDSLLMSPLGRSLTRHTDLGAPRSGFGAEPHPSSTDEYWTHHNNHFAASDQHIGRVMQQMSQKVMKEFGSEVLNPFDSEDPQRHTIARGNLQQIASAANFALMRLQMGDSYKSPAPALTRNGLATKMGPVGPVHPDSHAIVPPVYNAGDTDSWGHEMPTNLTWRFDPKQGGMTFNVVDEPFTLLQRTAHEGHVSAISPALASSNLLPKDKDINAISAVDSLGYSPLQTGLLHKSDDYEPNGVFKTLTRPAHTVYGIDDLLTIKGFSGEWVVQKMPKGKRMFIKKENKRVDPLDLSSKIKKALKERKGDFTVDGYVDGDLLNVVDLLVHKGTDLHMEPLEDRLNALRTLYHSDEFVHFPMPTSCITTDEDGLNKAVESLGGAELLIRDATSTFMKEKETHPKWVHFASEEISKQVPYPPLPEVMVKGEQILLAYPGLLEPVFVSGTMNENGMDIEKYEGMPTLIRHARTQTRIWGPVAIALLKEGDGGGMVSSTTQGTHQAVHSAPVKRKRPKKRKKMKNDLLVKAPELLDDSGEREKVGEMMVHARRHLTGDDEAKTSEELCTEVKGLTPKMIEVYGPEYGVERTENGDKWTVNEAIDDDIIENFAFPRMNRASPDGGAWSGMQADVTAPRGPTELVDDDATTFGAEGKDDEEVEKPPIAYHLQVRTDETLDGSATLDVEGERAIMRYPKRTPNQQKDEEEIVNEHGGASDDQPLDLEEPPMID